jgi:hypothetical protein
MVPIGKKPAPGEHKSSATIFLANDVPVPFIELAVTLLYVLSSEQN